MQTGDIHRATPVRESLLSTSSWVNARSGPVELGGRAGEGQPAALEAVAGLRQLGDRRLRVRGVEHDEIRLLAHRHPVVVEPEQPGGAARDHLEALADVIAL